MKKILTFVLMLVMVFSLASCAALPDDLEATLNGAVDKVKDTVSGIIGNFIPQDEKPHEHVFEVVEGVKVTCEADGYEKRACECGETEEEYFNALGHDMQNMGGIAVTCTKNGTNYIVCANCGKLQTETVEKLGHILEDPSEPSRFGRCLREGCGMTMPMFPETGKYSEYLTFTFGDEEKAVLEAKHNELLAILENADKYDPELHAYDENSALAESYAAAEAIYEEYSDLIFSAQGQYSIAQTLYYCKMSDKTLEENYNGMQTYYTELVAKFYSLSQPWYDSMYRDYFFYGATEEEINAFLFDSNAYKDPVYTELKNRNDAIELEFLNIANPVANDEILELYAEFVENNNKIALLLGYDNYLEYAYENIYDRDYTYQDVSGFVEYVKEYMVPVYNKLHLKWDVKSGYTQDDINAYYSVVNDSFFTSYNTNEMFNNYLDDMNMAFTSNPDKQISFSDTLNDLVSDGNLFRGNYGSAYVTYIIDGGFPIAYFGTGYDNSTTIAHEFGHYINEIYNNSEYNQSYDLLETHSQGHEMLYIYYVKDHISEMAFNLVETYHLLNMMSTVISAVQVDCFEQAIYLNKYDGYNSEIIMADGKITSDEYDLLYESISIDLGIEEDYRMNEYWRYGMTITSPCYYISYSVSAINAFQLYTKIYSDGFEAAKESYLKLITYTEIDPEMNTEQVLLNAGLLSYNDEQAYIQIAEFFKDK